MYTYMYNEIILFVVSIFWRSGSAQRWVMCKIEQYIYQYVPVRHGGENPMLKYVVNTMFRSIIFFKTK